MVQDPRKRALHDPALSLCTTLPHYAALAVAVSLIQGGIAISSLAQETTWGGVWALTGVRHSTPLLVLGCLGPGIPQNNCFVYFFFFLVF